MQYIERLLLDLAGKLESIESSQKEDLDPAIPDCPMPEWYSRLADVCRNDTHHIGEWLEHHKSPDDAKRFIDKFESLRMDAVNSVLPLHRRSTMFSIEPIPEDEEMRQFCYEAAVDGVFGEAKDLGGYCRRLVAILADGATDAHTGSEKPKDLITTEVAISEYRTSRKTIGSRIKEGKLTDYRPDGSPDNATYQLSRSELGRLFARKR